MTTPISAPRGVVPYILAKIDELTKQGYEISRVSLKILGRPFVIENDELVCYHSHRVLIKDDFTVAFDLNSYAIKLLKSVKKYNDELKEIGGVFGTLNCESRIEAFNELNEPKIVEIDHYRTGYFEDTWEDELFSKELIKPTSNL